MKKKDIEIDDDFGDVLKKVLERPIAWRVTKKNGKIRCNSCGKQKKDVFAPCTKKCEEKQQKIREEEAKEFARKEELRRSRPATVGDVEDLLKENRCNCC